MTDPPAGWSRPDAGLAATSAYVPPGSLHEAPYDSSRSAAVRGVIPLRPLGVGEILDGAVAVVRAVPRPVLAFAAAISVVTALLQLIVTLTVLGSVTSTSAAELTSSSDALRSVLGSALIGTGLMLFIEVISAAVLAGIVTAVVGRAVFGTPTTVGQAWEQVRPRLGRLVLLSVLIALAVYGSLFGGLAVFALLAQAGPVGALVGLFVLAAAAGAAVWLYVRWSLAPAVLVLEKQDIRTALRRSGTLVSRSWFRVLGVLLLALVIALFVGLVVQLPFQLLGYSPFAGLSQDYAMSTSQSIIGAIAGAFASTLVAPFSAGVRSLLYVDRRMRAEGLDVALVAATTGQRSG